MYTLEAINYWLALGTLLMQLVAAALLSLFFLRKKISDLEGVAGFLEKWGLHGGFLLTVGGIVLTLFYSDVLGFAACGLCWLQRVFLYPQAILFGLALWKKDRGIADYSIALSLLGGAVALYQHYLQMGGTSVLPCPAVPGATDCAQRFLFEFGYITFPLMAFTLFAFLIVLMLFVRRR